MSLTPGTRLGVFELAELLGRGGMGEVYRATDTKLKRQVAIKVLPPSMVADRDRLARFQREAEVLASLNHPNIAAIYGLEESDGITALVMELVEGDDLSQRIVKGAIHLDEALPIAKQIAEALEAAHEQGIIHRDLKPANIKVRSDGTVKVLDFGLAKAMEPAVGSAPSMTQSPTLTTPAMTQAGMILGTAAYMSPEQARGKVVDKRADIWAFGCVLYEMLTGRRAIGGDGVADTLAAVVRDDPDWSQLAIDTPESLRRLLVRCLDKNRGQRLRDIGDARFEIDDALAKRPAASPARTADSGRPAMRWGTMALTSSAVLAIGAAAAAMALWNRGGAGASVPIGASPHTVATQLTNYGGTEASGALSPDGRSFAFESDHGGSPDIWLRQVSGGEPIQLTHDAAEEADLAYAPDGESIYFTRTDPTGSGIWQIGALGGQPRKVLDGAQKPAPARDGRRLAAVTQGTNRSWTISVTDFTGGAVRDLVHGIENGYGSPRPAWSPDGRWLAYSAGALFGPAGVFVVDVGTGQQRRVIELPPGTNDSGQPAWLPDNRHLVVPYLPVSRQQAPADLGIVDVQDGSMSRLTTTVADGFIAPSVSADGSRLMVTSVRYINEVWSVPLGPDPDANGRAAVRLVDSVASPMWSFVSRDGRTLLFNSPTSGSRNLWTMPVDGRAPPRQITALPGDAVSHSSLSPDGTHVAFASIASGHSDIWTQNIDGSDLRQLTNDEPADSWPVWSPDGQWVAYVSFRETGGLWRVLSTGGPPEPFPAGPAAGDWIGQPNRNGTWAVRGAVQLGGETARSTAGRAIELVDVERNAVVWSKPLPGGGLPMFSPDGRSISAPFREARDHDAIRVFDVATGESRVAVRLPFHITFRASWVDNGRALLVNRQSPVTHIVLFDRFMDKEPAQRP